MMTHTTTSHTTTTHTTMTHATTTHTTTSHTAMTPTSTTHTTTTQTTTHSSNHMSYHDRLNPNWGKQHVLTPKLWVLRWVDIMWKQRCIYWTFYRRTYVISIRGQQGVSKGLEKCLTPLVLHITRLFLRWRDRMRKPKNVDCKTMFIVVYVVYCVLNGTNINILAGAILGCFFNHWLL